MSCRTYTGCWPLERPEKLATTGCMIGRHGTVSAGPTGGGKDGRESRCLHACLLVPFLRACVRTAVGITVRRSNRPIHPSILHPCVHQSNEPLPAPSIDCLYRTTCTALYCMDGDHITTTAANGLSNRQTDGPTDGQRESPEAEDGDHATHAESREPRARREMSGCLHAGRLVLWVYM